MTEPETQGRDERLKDLPTAEVIAELKQHHEAEVMHREAVTRHRKQVLMLADEVIRHRPRGNDVPEDERGWRISPLARQVLGVTYQAFREAMGAYWAEVAPGYSPDDRPVLTNEDRRLIRDRYRRGEAKYRIAKDMRVAPATIRAIVETHPKVIPYAELSRKQKAEEAHGARELRALRKQFTEEPEEPEEMQEEAAE